MNRTILLFSVLLFLFSVNSFAQISVEDYNREKEELTKKKSELTTEIEKLKAEIDSLEKLSPQLEQEILACKRDVLIIKYGKKNGQRVANKRIWKGMTEDMLRDSWGEPDKIDKNVEKWGVFTQWYYGDITFFFRDGKLTDWEEGDGKRNEEIRKLN